MSGAHFLEEIRQASPRWVDIENEKLGVEIGSELFRFGQRAGDCAEILRREFFQRRADRRSQRIVLFEKKNITLRHIRVGRFTTSRHLGKPSKFLEYDKAE